MFSTHTQAVTHTRTNMTLPLIVDVFVIYFTT